MTKTEDRRKEVGRALERELERNGWSDEALRLEQELRQFGGRGRR